MGTEAGLALVIDPGKALAELKRFERGIDSAANSVTNFARNVRRDFDVIGNAAGLVLKPLTALVGVMATAKASMLALGAASIGAAGQYEMFAQQLRVVIKTKEEADRAFRESLEFSVATPFTPDEIVRTRIESEAVDVRGSKAVIKHPRLLSAAECAEAPYARAAQDTWPRRSARAGNGRARRENAAVATAAVSTAICQFRATRYCITSIRSDSIVGISIIIARLRFVDPSPRVLDIRGIDSPLLGQTLHQGPRIATEEAIQEIQHGSLDDRLPPDGRAKDVGLAFDSVGQGRGSLCSHRQRYGRIIPRPERFAACSNSGSCLPEASSSACRAWGSGSCGQDARTQDHEIRLSRLRRCCLN